MTLVASSTTTVDTSASVPSVPASTVTRPAPSAPRSRPTQGHRRPGEGRTTAISIATVAVLFLLWWAAAALAWLPPLVLPSPASVWDAFVAAVKGQGQGGKPLLEHFLWSLSRVFGAFALACVTAVPVGILMGVSRTLRGIFDPIIEFYRPLPPLAYLPLVIIWFGIEETSKVVLIYLACFAPLAVAARAGVRSVGSEQIDAILSLGANRWQVIRHVVLPAALPDILTGMRIAIGFGWTTLVAAEMVAATAGLGQLVLNASNFLRTDVVVMGILVIGVVALLFDLLMRRIEGWAVPWKGRM
ncbi:ABC transporter permease subunit [Pseudacidovorax sp. RU35E]|uniref:ABC transporter permease subunit n=1 Tax=Pseudacidovorax sp. RU35E TaxID=1907403 RepID=UPI000955DB8A|nr:ABC transporter permease subunit [Pseudacidovorax sp. RU35E]SIQ37110.1 taurine transport system permease protein [Pseudacidovorax sp. RU35E]